MRFTGATTKREAIVTAIADYNRRRRMAALIVAHADEVRIGLGVIQAWPSRSALDWLRNLFGNEVICVSTPT